jgi:hypothetical protein
MKPSFRLLAVLSALALGACGPAISPEDSGGPAAPSQDTAALGPPSCDTVTIPCPYGGSVGCSNSNLICFAGRTFCSVICDNTEYYCPGTSLENCPIY